MIVGGATMKMPVLVLVLSLIFLLAGIAESWLHRKRTQKIPLRILVNGTRGKTSTTRLITAALQGGGLAVRGKCTGTDPREILPDGTEVETPRPHGARITEFKGFMRRAVNDKAEAVVCECMAVRPEMQQALARHFVRPTITVITNTLVDHVEEIGATEQETAASLSFSLHKNTALVTDAPLFAGYPGKVPGDTDALPEGYMSRFSFPVFEANIRLALKAAALAGVPRDKALVAMVNARPDTGMAGPFRRGATVVYNAFAANDAASTEALCANMLAEGGDTPLTVMFNNRADRMYRLCAFLPVLRGLIERKPRLMVIGEERKAAARFFEKKLQYPCAPMDTEKLTQPSFYQNRQRVFCIGNIKGAGRDMIRYLMEEEGKA